MHPFFERLYFCFPVKLRCNWCISQHKVSRESIIKVLTKYCEIGLVNTHHLLLDTINHSLLIQQLLGLNSILQQKQRWTEHNVCSEKAAWTRNLSCWRGNQTHLHLSPSFHIFLSSVTLGRIWTSEPQSPELEKKQDITSLPRAAAKRLRSLTQVNYLWVSEKSVVFFFCYYYRYAWNLGKGPRMVFTPFWSPGWSCPSWRLRRGPSRRAGLQ